MADIEIYDRFAGNPVLFEDDAISATGFAGGEIEIEDATVFVAVSSGAVWLQCAAAGDYRLTAGMYAALPAPVRIASHDCRALLATAKSYRGMFSLGGPLEDFGRLRYIDGCTDTGLIQPPRLGDPCLNYLHFPPGIRQTQHHHPSHRIGLIVSGAGLCHAKQTHEMRPHSIFVLPAGEDHFFETFDQTMRIVVFHPDSEFGPTDESHQMLNATLTRA